MNLLLKIMPLRFFYLIGIILSFCFYSIFIYKFQIFQPDLDEHLILAKEIFTKGAIPPHPLFFVLIGFPIWLFGDTLQITIICVFVFSVIQSFKLYYSYKLIEYYYAYSLNYLLAICLILFQVISVLTLFNDSFIKEQLSINYFHNGTMLLSLVFSLALFTNAIKYIRTNSNKSLLRIIIWGSLVILSKPSFIFCFIVAFPAYIYLMEGFSTKLKKSALTSLFFFLLILMQGAYIKSNIYQSVMDMQLIIKPFIFFGSVKNHLIILFNTLFLAILGITLFRKQFFSNLEYRIVFAMLIVAFFIAFNFADRFNGVIYPNMTWQVPIVLNILYVLLLGIFAKPDAGIAAWRRWIFVGCFLLYFAYGLYYLYMVKVFHTFFI